MGKRDSSPCSSCERVQSAEIEQAKIHNWKEHHQGSQQEYNRSTAQPKKSIWEIDKIHQTKSRKENHNSYTTEGSSPHHSRRCDGVGHGNQRRRKDNDLAYSNTNISSNHVNQDTVGRNKITIVNKPGDLGDLRNKAIYPPPCAMLQMPKVQPYLKHMPRQTRHLRALRRPTQNKDLRRQEEPKPDSNLKMQQLQRRPLHSKWKVSISQGDHQPTETFTTSGTIAQHITATTSQVGLDLQTTNRETSNTHDPPTTNKQVPATAVYTVNGGFPRYSPNYRQQDRQNPYTDSNQTNKGTTHPDNSYAGTTNPTEKKTTLRRLETNLEETSKEHNTTATTKQTRTSTFHQSPNYHRQTASSPNQDNYQRVSNVSEGHRGNKQANNDHATAVDVADGGHPTQPVYPQHYESDIPEHARHNHQIRILHWNVQGLNSKTKQSALIAAIQLDHIDVVMLQDSRIPANCDDKPPIRVPNCHTYFIASSAECHGLITIVRNNIPSKAAPTMATSEGTEILTVKVWINKKPTLLHNVYRVRGETAFTDILSAPNPSILAGDFNAHHTMWCRNTDRAGRILLEQIENANAHVIMNEPHIPTTQYDTTIDLTIVHTSLAAISDWSIYENLISDHFPIMLTIQTGYTSPVATSNPKWCLHKADWEAFKLKLTELSTTIKLNGSIEEHAKGLTDILLQAAECCIPKTNPHKKKQKYWCYNNEVKLTKWSLNRSLKMLRKKKRSGEQNLEPYRQKVREANIQYNGTCSDIRNKAWDEWITKNNTDLNSKTIWQRIKRCTGTKQQPPTHQYPQQESNRLLSEFVERSASHQLPEETNRVLQQHKPIRQQQLADAINSPCECDRPITISEISNVLNKASDSSPGEDTVSYSMIKNAPPAYIQQLAKLYTRSLQEGKLPSLWKLATIIPIPKKNKSYRPISLLSVIGKIMEKIILHRIRWSAISPNIRATGFKPGSGTRDAISILLHDISSSRSRRRRAAAVYIDLQKAFELVNKDVLLSELITAGLQGNLLAWISDFLSDRRAKVRFQNCHSDTQSFENGTPQGSSLSPTLFNYAMNIFLRLQLPEGVRILAYADDLVIYCVDRQNILQRLQSALDIMTETASSNGFRFAPEKTLATWFYRPNPDTKLQLYNHDINWEDQVRYLGVSIDKNLNMHAHVTQTINSVSRSLNTIKVMSALSGVNSKILLRAFNGCTRACLDYGAECFNMFNLTQMRQLQRKQNCGLKLVLGVNKWAPTASIHAELRILPLASRVEVFQANMINKILLNQNHPLQEQLVDELQFPRPRNTRNKLTWLTTICRSHRKLAPFIPEAEMSTHVPPWSPVPLQINTNDHLPPKHSTDPNVLYNITMATMTDIIQPPDHVYFTDGSVSEGRVSAAFTYLGQPTLIRISDNASIMQAELTAILATLQHGLHSPSRCVVFSDSKSALQAITQHSPGDNIQLLRDIRDAASRMTVPPLLAWIPSHIGIEGNETADQAARQALMKPVIDIYYPLSKARTRRTIKQTARDINETIEQHNPTRSVSLHQQVTLSTSDSSALLNMTNRSDQRVIFRLRLFVRPFIQIRHQDRAVCPHCSEQFDIYTVHYIAVCPASHASRAKLMVDVPIHMYYIASKQLTLEILRRQGARRHKELIQLIHKFPPAI